MRNDLSPGAGLPRTGRSAIPAVARAAFAALHDMLSREASVLIVTMVATNVVRLGSTLILTRLLAPEVFGAVGLIASIFYVLAMLTDLGFQNFIVRHPRGTERSFVDVLWTIHLVRGAVLSAAAALVAWPLAEITGKPFLFLPFLVASLTFAIAGLGSLSLLTAVRVGLVRRLCVFDLGLTILQTIVAILAAAVFASVWAIIIAMLVHAAVRSLLSYIVFPDAAQSLRHDPAVFGEFWRFSRVIMTSSAITVLLSQSDKLVLAGIMPLDAFGLYTIAASLTAAPFAFVVAYTSKLLYPRYASAWREATTSVAAVYYSARRKVSILYCLAAGGLIGTAPLVIEILYDPRYQGAAQYLVLLALSPALALATVSATEFLMAIGNTYATVYANIARVIWLFVAGTIGFVAIGPIGIAAAAGTMELAPLALTWILLRRVGVLDLRKEGLFLATSAAGAALGYAATLVLLPFF